MSDGLFVILRDLLVLADGLPDGALVIDGPMINGQRVLDVEPYIFAAGPVIFDRNGDFDVCTFTIARVHASKSLSLDHALRHGQATRGVADLILQFTEDGSTRLWRSRRAGWEAHQVPAPEGYSSAVRYKVICPGFDAPSTTEGEALDGSELTGDLDGGDDNAGVLPTGSWDCLSEGDDDGAVVRTFDGGTDV